MHRFKNFLHRIMPVLCQDCRRKIAVKYGLRTRLKRSSRKVRHHSKKSSRKLKAGIHRVVIRGKSRKVKVLANGRWRFMKG